ARRGGSKLNIDETGGRSGKGLVRAVTATQNGEGRTGLGDGVVFIRQYQVLIADIGHGCGHSGAGSPLRLVSKGERRTIAVEKHQAIVVTAANVGDDQALGT